MDIAQRGTAATDHTKTQTGCANYFYETAAAPNSLGSVMRQAVIVRNVTTPLTQPFMPHGLQDYDD